MYIKQSPEQAVSSTNTRCRLMELGDMVPGWWGGVYK